MLNERPEGKDKFGYVLIGLLVAFVIILVTSAVIWNSNHPEKVQENFEKIDTQQAEEKKGAKLGPYTIQLKDKKVVDCVGGALYTYSGINVIPTCDWDHPRVWFLVVFSTAGNLDPRCRGYDPWGSRTLRGVSTGGVESFVVFP